VARETIDGRLQVDAPHALERADEEGVHDDQLAGAVNLDLALAELRAEAFKQADLLVAELDLAFGDALFQPQQARLLGQQVVAAPRPRARRRN
jgi:hypothetical protein